MITATSISGCMLEKYIAWIKNCTEPAVTLQSDYYNKFKNRN